MIAGETRSFVPQRSTKTSDLVIFVEMTQLKRVLFATNYTNRRVLIQKLLSNQLLLSDQSVIKESGRIEKTDFYGNFLIRDIRVIRG